MTRSAGGGWGSRRRDAHALLPQVEMAEDVLDQVAAVDERNDTHLFLALRREERIGFPDLFEKNKKSGHNFPPCRGAV